MVNCYGERCPLENVLKCKYGVTLGEGGGGEFERKERRVQRLSVEVYSLGVELFCQL